MEDYFAGKLTEIQETEDTAYLLENNEIFYDIGYKVMQNQENVNLLKCHRLKYNGKIKLVYFTRDDTSLADCLAKSDIDGVLNLIHRLIEAMLQIENLGFLNMACIDNRLSHIFVEPGTQNVKIIYLPVNLAGVGTYTRQTFSSERYTIWTMQSNYHNLPMINGVPQKYGPKRSLISKSASR